MPMGDATFTRHDFGLSEREFEVLDYLRTFRPRIVSGSELRYQVFGQFADETAERECIRRIRLKLGDDVIITIRGVGYRFGLGPVAEALPRCLRCGCAVGREDTWQCFGCGAQGERRSVPLAVDLDVGRAEYAEGSTSGKAWTDEERDYILARRNERNDRQIADELNRSPSGVRAERKRLERERGLPKKKYISGDDGGDK